MKHNHLIIFAMTTIFFISCGTETKKEEKNNLGKLTMNWTEDKKSEMLTTVSHSENKQELFKDLLATFNKIQKEKIFTDHDILVYVDATNGIIFFSGLSNQNENSNSSLTMSIETPEIWEQYLGNADDFDELVKSSIKYSAKSSEITKSKKVYVEDELGETICLN